MSALRSKALIGLLIFCLSNVAALRLFESHKNTPPSVWQPLGETQNLITSFRQIKERPEIVLLGSSLMMYPFWAADYYQDHGVGSIFTHHQANCLADALVDTGVKKERIFNLASSGQMSSDSFIFTKELLSGDRQPNWLVLGIAPRDFVDATIAAPTITPTFQTLVGLKNVFGYQDALMPDVKEKIEFVADHSVYFYGKRARLQHEYDKAVNKFVTGLQERAGIKVQKEQNWHELIARAHEQVKAGIAPKTEAGDTTGGEEAGRGFQMIGTKEERFRNSLAEYRKRYAGIEDRDTACQFDCLDRTLKLCSQRGIHVLLVNLPLTEINKSIMPNGFYQKFEQHIATIASRHQVELLDLGNDARFTESDFWDTTHLKDTGGFKLASAIATKLEAGQLASMDRPAGM